jgi:glucosamine 6-phosphate synthetase-like amidotransferase/phosphosugar isomerase protein
MCGITAFSRANPTSIPNGMRFAHAAALAIESRGRHATGFGWADPADGWPTYWRAPGAARVVAGDAPLPDGIQALIGHTRYATKGDPKINVNNHPVVGPGIVLVHNGRVDNDDELIELSGLERTGDVDSQALPLLLGSDLANGVHPVELLELVEGVAAIAWLDADSPHTLHLARLATRPLWIGRTRRGDLIASSTDRTLALTAKLAGVSIVGAEPVPEGTYLRVEAGRIVERRSFAVAEAAPAPDDVPATRVQLIGSIEQERAQRQLWRERVVHDGLVERLPEWRAR